MPQYFFIVCGSDTDTEDDRQGIDLPDLGAALSYAERTVRERQKSAYRPPGPMMIVTDEAGQTVLTLPFFRACA